MQAPLKSSVCASTPEEEGGKAGECMTGAVHVLTLVLHHLGFNDNKLVIPQVAVMM